MKNNLTKEQQAFVNSEMCRGYEDKVTDLLHICNRNKGTTYFKWLIAGNTGIYFASPVHNHSDYNKCRVFDKNEKTLHIISAFNKLFKI